MCFLNFDLTNLDIQKMKDSNIPKGFKLLNRNSPFSDLSGPYYEKLNAEGKHEVLGIRLRHEHLNKIRVVHGGIMMTIADNAFGDAIQAHYDQPVSLVTVSFSAEFLSAGKEGDWVEARVKVKRAGKRLVFADCELTIEDKLIFTASSVFMIVNT